MKRTLILSLILVLAAACSSKKEAPVKLASGSPAYVLAKDLAAAVPALDPEKVTLVATSRNFDVTAGEVLQAILDTTGSQAQQLKGLDTNRLKAVVEQLGVQLGERRLLVAAAVEAKKAARPEEIKAALDARYAGAGGEAAFLENLKAGGVSPEAFKKMTAEDLTIRKYLEGALSSSSQVTEAEIRRVYQEDKTASVRHILLLTQGKSAAEKADIRKKMEGILARAQKGEDFAALAKEYSEDPGSKDNGGLYADFARGTMVKPFEDAAFSVPVGQISGIVETSFGYHIIKVENRKKETQPYEQAKAQIEAQIKEQKQAEAFDALLTRLKDKARFRPVPLI
jgi:parvulin-like peptidyl-prolyl isomerase